MTRVEHLADGVTLYQGDCREIMPGLGRFDAVITDPPYGVGFKYESHIDDKNEYPILMRSVISALPIDNGPCVFWQGMLNCDRWHEWFPKGFRIFAAAKGFVQYRPTAIQYAWDPVIFWGTPKTSPNVTKRDYHLQSLAPFGCGREKINHPCPRPYEQVRYVVECFTVQNDAILDPFMGSGTTGVAAVNVGRQFTGIELEPKYFDIACRRISEALKQPDMFVEPPKPAKQEALL